MPGKIPSTYKEKGHTEQADFNSFTTASDDTQKTDLNIGTASDETKNRQTSTAVLRLIIHRKQTSSTAVLCQLKHRTDRFQQRYCV